MSKGKIIVIEGSCDGVGKSTQLKLLKAYLEQNNYEIYSHHFPSYNTYQGLPVEKYLKGEYGSISELSPYFISSLYANDRSITYHTILKEQYESGKIILLDRYTTSSLIYQASMFDNILDKINYINYQSDYEYNKLLIGKPDIVIFLHVPFDLSVKLRQERSNNEGIINDIHEQNNEFLKKNYDTSLITAKHCDFEIIECANNNELKSRNEIHEEIKEKVLKLL